MVEKRIADNKKDIERASHKNLEDYFEGYKDALALFKQQFLDTIEVKEVDLDKEVELIANDIMIGVQANRYNTVVYNTKRCDFNHSHLMLAARKGIELGLSAGNSVDNKA